MLKNAGRQNVRVASPLGSPLHRDNRLWNKLARSMKPRLSIVIIVLCFALGAWGYWKDSAVRIGDTQAGIPELRQNSRYHQDTRVITSKFSIGLDILSAIVETVPNGCVDYEVVTLMDQFEGRIRAVLGVQSAVSLPSVATTISAGYSEGSLKWRILPRNPQTLAQVVSPIETAAGLLKADASVMPVMIFLSDHKAGTLLAVTDAVKDFAAGHSSPKAKFLLASGNAGVMAATNEVVAAAGHPILLWVFGAVIALCLITFRDVRVALCIVVPLALVSLLAYALMAYLGIGLETSTLPVVALGVDYGIYIFARLQAELKAGEYFEDAMFSALKDAGVAVVFTGRTLAIGVST